MVSRRRHLFICISVCVVSLALLSAIGAFPHSAAGQDEVGRQARGEAAPAHADLALSDAAWDVTLGNPGPSSYIETLEIAGDWLYVGGDFYCVAGVCGYGYIARWNLITQQWESLGGGVGEGPLLSVQTTLVSPDGRYVLVGGAFETVYNGLNRQEAISTGNNPNLARYDTVTKTWQVFQTTRTHLTSDRVYEFAILDGRLYVSGWNLIDIDPDFPDNETEGLVRWSGDPFAATLVGEWEGVGGGIYYNEGVDSYYWSNVNVLTPLGDGTLLVGGCFTQVADRVSDPPIPITVNGIAAWDPVAERWKKYGNGASDCVIAADVSGGSIMVGGREGLIANCAASGCTPLAALSEPRTDPDTPMPFIKALTSIGGKLYAGGRFNPTDHNSPAKNLAVQIGGNWVELGGGADNSVYALATDGRYLYVGGVMHRVGSKDALYLARWDTQGATASPWTIQDVVTATYMYGDPVGTASSMALDQGAFPQFAFFDGRTDDLIYAWQENSTWYTQTVDSEGNTGHSPRLALDAGGNPHISYYDMSKDRLRYAYWNGSDWVLQTVDSHDDVTGINNGSLALDKSGAPHLAYQYFSWNDAVSELRYARISGGKWVTQTVESSNTSSGLGRDASIALDISGHPHISYVHIKSMTGTGDLRYAHWNGSQWALETVDGSGDVGGTTNARAAGTSLRLDAGGYPHISYYNDATGNPMYAYKDSKGWHTQAVSSHDDKMGQHNSLALDSDGLPHMSFYNGTKKTLQYAVKTVAGWDVQTVEEEGDPGAWSTLLLDRAGNPHIGYYFRLDPDNGIRHATLPGKSLNTGEVSGPSLAQPGAPVVLTAVADMPGATLPITFTWNASPVLEPATQSLTAVRPTLAAGRAQTESSEPIVHVVNGLTDTATFTWEDAGAYNVAVSMISRNGLVANASIEVNISSVEPLYLPFMHK